MKFGFLTEGDTPPGASAANRLHEVIREAQFCDEMNFDFWGSSEQHFTDPVATISAPEVLYGAVAQATSRIKLRSMSTVLLHFNHPIRSAERLATLDILSRGRMQFGTARGNNAGVVKTFEIDADGTRAEWLETLEVIVKALTTHEIEHHGEFYNIEPTIVWPRLYQPQFPEIHVAATSLETHIEAGKMGIGVMNASPFAWDYLEDCIKAYKDALKEAKPLAGVGITSTISLGVFGVHCARTRAIALEEARPSSLGFAKFLMSFYAAISETSPGYAYLAGVKETLGDRADDLPYLVDALPWFLVGAPDDIIKRIREFEAMGVDEVILRMDGHGHHKIMESIEMFGKYVLPEFQNPGNIVRGGGYEEYGVESPPYML